MALKPLLLLRQSTAIINPDCFDSMHGELDSKSSSNCLSQLIAFKILDIHCCLVTDILVLMTQL